MLHTLLLAALGTAFLFLMTTLGAGTVLFFAREGSARTQRAMLGFAAGAMLCVTAEELIPRAGGRDGTCAFLVGFLLMMALDVGLG